MIFLITSLLVLIKASPLISIEIPQYLYFGWFLILFLFFMFNKPRINAVSFFLISVCLISLVINLDILESARQPWIRYLTFVVMFVSVGPFFNGYKVDRIKEALFFWMNYAFGVAVVISFFLIISGSGVAFYRGSSGLFYHSMVLSPLSAIATLFFFHLFLTCKDRLKWVFLSISFISMLTSAISTSLAAFGSLVISILFYLFFFYYGKPKVFLRTIISIFVVLVISFPFWIDYFDRIIQKKEKKVESENILSGRDRMWEDRLLEIEYSPVLGIGFANIYVTDNSKIDFETGTYESGSGWLTVLSMIGLLGFSTILLLFFRNFKYIAYFARRKERDFILFSSYVVFFSIHLLVEGYIFGVGGPLFIFLWLSVSVFNQRKYTFK